jgi:hypothetical protein
VLYETRLHNTFVSSIVAIVAAVLQKRAQKTIGLKGKALS